MLTKLGIPCKYGLRFQGLGTLQKLYLAENYRVATYSQQPPFPQMALFSLNVWYYWSGDVPDRFSIKFYMATNTTQPVIFHGRNKQHLITGRFRIGHKFEKICAWLNIISIRSRTKNRTRLTFQQELYRQLQKTSENYSKDHRKLQKTTKNYNTYTVHVQYNIYIYRVCTIQHTATCYHAKYNNNTIHMNGLVCVLYCTQYMLYVCVGLYMHGISTVDFCSLLLFSVVVCSLSCSSLQLSVVLQFSLKFLLHARCTSSTRDNFLSHADFFPNYC